MYNDSINIMISGLSLFARRYILSFSFGKRGGKNMRNPEKDAVEQAKRRQAFLEHGFAQFSSKSIEAVSLQDVAKDSGYGIATLYRYFTSKAGFCVAIAEWKWGEFFIANRRRRPNDDFKGMTAADMLSFYLDSFLEVYQGNKELLRFNQLFNIYIRSEEVDADTVTAYRGLMKPITDFFHLLCQVCNRP